MRISRKEEDTGQLLPSSFLSSFHFLSTLVNTGVRGFFLRRGEERGEEEEISSGKYHMAAVSSSSFFSFSFSSGRGENREVIDSKQKQKQYQASLETDRGHAKQITSLEKKLSNQEQLNRELKQRIETEN